MKHLFTRSTWICAAVLTIAAPTAHAAPTVSGNTISWPDDGWYQVQTSDGLTELCNGTDSCTVEPGTYVVINHTTGERFENVQVGSDVEDVVTVTGNVISWPNNGWYQVQTSDGLTELCNGTDSCTVAPGTYIVINHSTGSRFENVQVFGDEDLISVNGNVISWPDNNNWYQVQTADGLTELCNGTDSCTVEPGTYLVINHTTGQRYTGITVEGMGVGPVDPEGPEGPEEPPVGESDFQITVANQEAGMLEVSVAVPDPESGELGGDFMILFDRSGSFDDDLNTFRQEVNEIELALAENFSNFRIGLGSFVDAPCEGFGSAEDMDFGYELNLPMSPPGNLSETLDELDIRYGVDGPESQLEAMRQAMTGEGHIVDPDLFPSCSPVANIMATSPGWDDTRVRFLLVSTDAEFHRPTDTNYPYQTSVQDVINLATESKTTILFLNSSDDADADSSLIAEATGGSVSNLGSASEEIVATLKAAVASTITNVEVFMRPVGDGAEFVSSIDPERVELNLLEDRNVDFQVNFLPTLPPSDEDRVFTFELVTEAQGAEISRLTVELTVPADS